MKAVQNISISPYVFAGLRAEWVNTMAKTDKSIAIISERVCSFFGLPPESIFEASRAQPVVKARQAVFYILRHAYSFSLKHIASKFGMHHTSVMHNLETAKQHVIFDVKFRKLVVDNMPYDYVIPTVKHLRK